ncbi:MAG TPA: crossover junction endodeoxyribonuclease RuvC [candidate division Zixibacteria bacterium]|nr:crossover junction endodeoxyribonuclease RuvC [candidate division Zixibacteria bacterium]
MNLAPRRVARNPVATVILGIDPGSIVTGWGVVEAAGSSAVHVAHGVITSDGAVGPAARLGRIYRGIQEVFEAYRPAVVSLERVFFARNAQSALKLGQARGVALLAAAHHGASVYEYAAAEIKAAVVGYGRATKEQVQMMVCSLLGLRGTMAEDASDALAAAICHANRSAFHSRLPAAVGRPAPFSRRRNSPF